MMIDAPYSILYIIRICKNINWIFLVLKDAVAEHARAAAAEARRAAIEATDLSAAMTQEDDLRDLRRQRQKKLVQDMAKHAAKYREVTSQGKPLNPKPFGF